MAFNNKKLSFAERLNSAKSIFKKAYDEVSDLSVKLYTEIEAKKSELLSLEDTYSETNKFINNIKEFIG